MSRTTATAVAALGAGLITYGTGRITGHNPAMALGLILAVAAVPAVIIAAIRHACALDDDRLAAEHRAGYLLGLDHADRGLLTPPPTTPSSSAHRADCRHLHAVHPTPDRKAQ